MLFPSAYVSSHPQLPNLNKASSFHVLVHLGPFFFLQEQVTSHQQHFTVYKVILLSKPGLIFTMTYKVNIIILISQVRKLSLKKATWLIEVHAVGEWLSYHSNPSPASDSCPDTLKGHQGPRCSQSAGRTASWAESLRCRMWGAGRSLTEHEVRVARGPDRKAALPRTRRAKMGQVAG